MNTASRMSTTCEANEIQISRQCFSLLKPDFICQYHGKRKVKGKQDMDTYLLKDVIFPGSLAQPAASSASVAAAGAAPRSQSAPLSGLDEKEPPAVYHALPVPGQLYSNVAPSPQQLATMRADDPAAIRREVEAGKTVHRLRRQEEGAAAAREDEAGGDEEKRERWPEEHKQQQQQQNDVESHTSANDGALAAVRHPASPQHASDFAMPTFPHSAIPSSSSSSSSSSFSSPLSSPSSRIPPTISIPSPSQHSSSPVPSSAAVLSSSSAAHPTARPASPSASSSAQQPASTSPTTPSTPLSQSGCESPDASAEQLPSPSTLYTLSAEQVKDTFVSHTSSSHTAAFLDRHSRVVSPQTPTHHNHHSDLTALSAASSSASPSPASLSARLSLWKKSLAELLRKVALSFRPAFEDDAVLKSEFQSHWVRRNVDVSRLGFTVCVLGFLALGDVELVTCGSECVDNHTWLLRSPAIALGLAVLLFSYVNERLFRRWQQPIVAVSWTLMTMLTIGVSILRDDNTLLYGVSATILLVTTSSFFVGLQFRWVSFTTLPILTFYFCGAFWHPSLESSGLNSFFLLAAVCLSMMSAHAAEYFARLDFIRHRTLNEEEAKTRYILDNMLPKEVMDQLVQQHLTGRHSIIAQQCERAAVLFCDIVQFTALAAVIRPEDVVAILNVLFSTFDALTTLHGVYKVETIGDAYLACSGVVRSHSASDEQQQQEDQQQQQYTPPTQQEQPQAQYQPPQQHSHVESLVLCALDFIAASRHCRTPDHKRLQIRIGIHTGTVVAGVIGVKMPRYHLFGETGHTQQTHTHTRTTRSAQHSQYDECCLSCPVAPCSTRLFSSLPFSRLID